MALESRKLIPAELNYTTTEKECLAVIHALKIWRYHLEGQTAEHFTIVTDQKPLVHLPKQPTLSRRIARWSEYLESFTFTWQYRPGRINVADPVSKRPDIQYSLVSVNALTGSLKAARTPSVPSAVNPAASPGPSDVKEPEADLLLNELAEPTPAMSNDDDLPALPASQSAAVFRDSIIQGYKQDSWFSDP